MGTARLRPRKTRSKRLKLKSSKQARAKRHQVKVRNRLTDHCCECKRLGWVNRGIVKGKWLERLCICIDGAYRCLNCIPHSS